MATDPNLLLGVFALQAGLIDGRQFVEACTAWAERRQGSLADLLAERGWLTPAGRAEVERRLEQTLSGTDDKELSHAYLTPYLPDAATADRPAARPTSAAPEVPAVGYELLGVLGKGGMGVVYRARQTTLNRLVAVKMIQPEVYAGPAELARFRTEAEAAAALQHPNIVQVHEVGTQDGRPFLALEYVDGGSLADRLEGTPLPARAAAELVETLARAIHYAHERGVVHRDLKPANVLLTAGGTPKVADFGLAKRLEGEAGQTRTGAVLGTPNYMAPEQAAGRVKEVGPAADTYGLGAILYEMLTGRPPFQGTTLLETLEQVRSQAPVPPRLLRPQVPRDLETVCLKCLEKDSARRYASARELADELRRYLNGEPIRARSFNLLDRFTRALEHRHHDVEFRSWGNLLLLLAPLVALGHLTVLAVALWGGPWLRVGIWLPIVLLTANSSLLFWHPRLRGALPTTPAVRQLWALMVSQSVGGTVSVLLVWRVVAPDLPFRELAAYPVWAILTGEVFFVLGSTYWGRCYLFGAVSFALAVLMLLRLVWAPVEMAGLAFLTITAFGLHLRRLGKPSAG
jgi:serine/threonine-protein kinase